MHINEEFVLGFIFFGCVFIFLLCYK